jgi:hypothetical protein
VQNVVILLGAYLVCDQCVVGRTLVWFAACDEIGSGSADGVLDEVRDEEGED